MTATAGYSGRPLSAKLGFKPGMVVLLRDPPAVYPALLADAADVSFVADSAGLVDAVHRFLTGATPDPDAIRADIAALKPGGMLWLSWAKKASALFSGITEDDLRRAVLPLGWVDVKVCAVDADWSGLKFLRRRA